MRQESIYSGGVAAGQNVVYKLENGHSNGLLFFSDAPITDAAITVKRNSPARCFVLSAGIEVKHFARISDVERGATANRAVLHALRGLLTTDHDGAGTGVAVFTPAQFKQYVTDVLGPQDVGAFFLDLGSIYTGPNSSIELSIKFGAALSDVRIYSVSFSREPDRMVEYNTVVDREQHLTGIDRLYLSANGASLLNQDAAGLFTTPLGVSVQIEDHDGPWLTDVAGLVAAATVLGRTESHVESAIVLAYDAPDALPASVYYKLSGADVANVTPIVVRNVFDPAMVSANTRRELAGIRQRTAQLEAADPATAKALRHAGVAAKSSDLAAVEAQATA
jgi:hypothetical protein